MVPNNAVGVELLWGHVSSTIARRLDLGTRFLQESQLTVEKVGKYPGMFDRALADFLYNFVDRKHIVRESERMYKNRSLVPHGSYWTHPRA